MIYIANKTREIEKNNNNLISEILKINDDLKINKIELLTHQNNSYLKKLYSIYISNLGENKIPNVISINQISKKEQNIKLVKTNN